MKLVLCNRDIISVVHTFVCPKLAYIEHLNAANAHTIANLRSASDAVITLLNQAVDFANFRRALGITFHIFDRTETEHMAMVLNAVMWHRVAVGSSEYYWTVDQGLLPLSVVLIASPSILYMPSPGGALRAFFITTKNEIVEFWNALGPLKVTKHGKLSFYDFYRVLKLFVEKYDGIEGYLARANNFASKSDDRIYRRTKEKLSKQIAAIDLEIGYSRERANRLLAFCDLKASERVQLVDQLQTLNSKRKGDAAARRGVKQKNN